MTPAEAAVLADTLRSVSIGGKLLDEVTVARMVRAVDGAAEHALKRYDEYVSGRWAEILNGSRRDAPGRRKSNQEWIAVCDEVTRAASFIPTLSPAEPPAANQTRDDGASETS